MNKFMLGVFSFVCFVATIHMANSGSAPGALLMMLLAFVAGWPWLRMKDAKA